MGNQTTAIAMIVLFAAAICVAVFFLYAGDPGEVTSEFTDCGHSKCTDALPRTTRTNSDTREHANSNNVGNTSDSVTGEPPFHEPEPAEPDKSPKPSNVTLLDSTPPRLAWNLGKAEYERILVDANATAEDKSEAQSRLLLDFFRWPGRDANRLGGFEFDQTKYRVLEGFERQSDKYTKEVTVRIDGNPPNVLLQRRVVLNKAPARIELVIRVMSSREWAQRYFLGWIAGPTRTGPGMPSLGGDVGVFVGDVSSGSAEDALASKGDIKFVRHNVSVSIEFYNTSFDEDPVSLNIVALAQELDQEIRAQAHAAAEWAELAPHRPVVSEYAFAESELPTRDGNTTTLVVVKARHPEDDPVYFEWKGEPTVGVAGGLGVNPGKPESASIFPSRLRYEARPYKAWLVVYDDSLLFTVAEASIMVRPPKDK